MTLRDSTGIRLLLFQELGNMLSSRGEYERAETFYQRSLAICRKLENLNLQVIILYGLWINCQAQGENGACKQFYSEIVDVLGEDIGPLHSLVWGRICERTGDHDQAIQYYTAVLQYGRQHGDLRLAAQASYRLGWVHLELENNDSSSEYLEQGLSAAQEAREMVLVADCLSALGQVQFYGKKDHARARKCLDESLAVSEELGDKRRIAKCLWHLARWEETTGSMTKARILIGEALALAQQLRMEPQVAEIRSDWLRIRDKYLGRDDTILLSGDGTDTHSHEIIVNESG